MANLTQYGDLRLAGAFAALAVLGHVLSRRVIRSILVRIDLLAPLESDVSASSAVSYPTTRPVSKSASSGTPHAQETPAPFAPQGPVKVLTALEAQNPASILRLYSPRLWRPSLLVSRDVRREDILCNVGHSVLTGLRVRRPGRRGLASSHYLFPTPGWKSANLAYLKVMLYGDFFRPEEAPPPPDSDALAIEGFGPYRPAQFADTHHPRFQWHLPSSGAEGSSLTDDGSRVPVPGTPFSLQHGAVWAEFVMPPRPTLEQRRAWERERTLYGGPRTPPAALPAPAAPVSLMLDGSTFAPLSLGPGGAGGSKGGGSQA